MKSLMPARVLRCALFVVIVLGSATLMAQDDEPYYMKRMSAQLPAFNKFSISTNLVSAAFLDIPLTAEVRVTDRIALGGGIGYLPARKYSFWSFGAVRLGHDYSGFITTNGGYSLILEGSLYNRVALEGRVYTLRYRMLNFPDTRIDEYLFLAGNAQRQKFLPGALLTMKTGVGISIDKASNPVRLMPTADGEPGVYFRLAVQIGIGYIK